MWDEASHSTDSVTFAKSPPSNASNCCRRTLDWQSDPSARILDSQYRGYQKENDNNTFDWAAALPFLLQSWKCNPLLVWQQHLRSTVIQITHFVFQGMFFRFWNTRSTRNVNGSLRRHSKLAEIGSMSLWWTSQIQCRISRWPFLPIHNKITDYSIHGVITKMTKFYNLRNTHSYFTRQEIVLPPVGMLQNNCEKFWYHLICIYTHT